MTDKYLNNTASNSRASIFSESPQISGLLYKRRGGFGKMMPNAWQFRLFVLSKDGILAYYDTEEVSGLLDNNKDRGHIDLKNIHYSLLDEHVEGAPTTFLLSIIPDDGSEKWRLCAETKEDYSRWWNMIEKYCIKEKVNDNSLLRTQYLNRQSIRTSLMVTSTDEEQLHDDDISGLNNNTTNNQQDLSRMKSRENSNLEANSIDYNVIRSVSSTTNISNTTTTNTTNIITSDEKLNHKQQVPERPSLKRRKSVKTKKGLKLSKQSDIFPQESIEFYLVIIIINITTFGIIYSYRRDDILKCVIYFICMNYVIIHTLLLRQNRYDVLKLKLEQTLESLTEIQSNTMDLSVREKASIVPVVSPLLELTNEGNTELSIHDEKPIAGQTLQRVYTEPKLSPAHTWCRADHRQFNVRVGPDYNRYKKKAPSSVPLYEAFAVDVFCTKTRVDHAARRFQLPDTSHIHTHNQYVPPIFVIQIQIPSEPPTSIFSSSEDGPGWAIMMYYMITEDTCNQLKDLTTASASVKLFAEWCEKSPVDAAWRGRFKVINSCTNLEELGMPSAIVSYNAKPVLIRRTGTIFRGDNHMEMNIHVHKFANLGFVIEGRDDKELPETLFACVAVNKPQEEHAQFLFDED